MTTIAELEQRDAVDRAARDVLRRAAEVLRSSGWCRYELGPANCAAGPHCALGAIHCVADRTSQVNELARRRLSAFLIERRGMPWMQQTSRVITEWNDRRTRTAEEVVAALEEAAAAP